MATIVKLPESTISMIAAGEIITKPVNVIKELLENSLDANSTNIRITIDFGGIKLIEIVDNGHGIARNNAILLCQRYATSKLKNADDLIRITTFGFRGEALASISEMADIEVRTFNQENDKMGWCAKYKNGLLVQPPKDKYLQNPGTHLRITNLFQDMKQRKKAINVTAEKRNIMELITNYGIHHRDRVTMSLKEFNFGEHICILAPYPIKPCIGRFFGVEMENTLVELHVNNHDPFKVDAHIVFAHKKSTGNSTFILFVNHRLVECADLKRETEALVCEYLNPKQNCTFLYISLQVPPNDVDVNTHPAKATVLLHYHIEITALISKTLRDKLNENLSTQSIIPNTTPQKSVSLFMKTTPKRQYDIVHNDSSQQTLTQTFFKAPNPSQENNSKMLRRDLKLRSVNDLRKQVAQEKSRDNAATIKKSVFVGIFDHDRALIQSGTKLYAINLKAFLKEQYYQFYLFDFGNFPPIEILPPGNKIQNMIEVYLNDVRKHELSRFNKFRINTTKGVVRELLKHSAMLEDYIGLKFTQDEIQTIPCIMPDEVPNLAYLGRFLVELANDVDYTQERECFRTIGRVVADFYAEAPANLKDQDVHRRYHNLIESKLYVAIKNYLLIPEWLFTKENICQISDTKDLFKVFERC